MYVDKLVDIVNKYDNAYHRTTKIKPVDVKPSTYLDSSKEISYKDSKFKIGDIVRISKYKNVFVKGYGQNWSEEVLETFQKVKRTVPWIYVISDLKGKEIVGTFYDKE